MNSAMRIDPPKNSQKTASAKLTMIACMEMVRSNACRNAKILSPTLYGFATMFMAGRWPHCSHHAEREVYNVTHPRLRPNGAPAWEESLVFHFALRPATLSCSEE